MKRYLENRTTRHLLSLVLSASLAFPLPSLAASVALATSPLATSTTSTVKPNIMFILDNSGSMSSDYLPDWANDPIALSPTCSGGCPSNYSDIPALHRNNGFNGVAYNAAITYTPPVLYNADGTLNTTTYPNIGSPWTSVKNDAFGKITTSTTNLVTSFPDVEWCTSSAYTTCLRNDNLILPGTVAGSNYVYAHSKNSTGSGNVATGNPGAATTAARSFGPYYYTIVPGEYCDSENLKNCQFTQTATFNHPALLRWCDSAALTNCQGINNTTFKYPRYPTIHTPAVAYAAAVPAVVAVTGVYASRSFTFTNASNVSPVGFSIKVNGTEILTSFAPGSQSSTGLATWVQSNSTFAGYTITKSGSTVTITSNTADTSHDISSIVVSETATTAASSATIGAATAGVTAVTAVRPTALITFSGAGNATSASIARSLSGSKTITVGGVTGSTSNPCTIGANKTTVQAAAAVVACVGTGNTVKAYVGGNAITPTCATKTTSQVCLVDNGNYTNGTAVAIGTYTASGTLSMSTTPTAGGASPVTAVNAKRSFTFTNSANIDPTGFSIKVNGTEILTSSAPGSQSSTTLAIWVKNNSSLAGYTITNPSAGVVTITSNTADTTHDIGSIVVTSNTLPAATATVNAAVAGVTAVTGSPYIPEVLAVPASDYGRFIRTDIVSTNDSYPYPGTTTKASTRTDCAGTTCTYAEEMTNFANWWTYYQTRMQSMKSSVSRAFKTLDNRFRVGYTTISDTGAVDGTNFLGNNTFELAHKNSWFTKLFAASGSSTTPLRGSLSKAGRYYANQLSGQVDPIQYSCQQNFTILSTDGYWNKGSESASYINLDVTGGLIGDKDGGTTARPMYEGPTASSGSLADIAKYYYDTDLRTSTFNNCDGGTSTDYPSGNTIASGKPGVCTNNVFISSTDKNVNQHMTTFTMGLGADGTLNFTTDYQDATSGDFYNLKNGLGSPTVNWPDPQVGSSSNTVVERIDDLWHAAVNGQGIYFSAKDPNQIITGFNKALSAITAKLGAAAAAATSTLNPVAGNNYAYVASYTTNAWKGNLESRSINVTTGAVSETATWCVENIVAGTCASPGTVVANTSGASTIYNCVTAGATVATCTAPGVFDAGTNTCTAEIPVSCTGTMAAKIGATTDTRTIYTAPAGGLTPLTGQNLVPFDAAYEAANPANFSTAHITGLNGLSGAQLTAAAGVNMINYLRGQYGFEERSAIVANRLYRTREATLGDALESQPSFISKPLFSYPYPGYSTYKTDQSGRAGTVYMGTNDGMMHAFAASDGVERWAYVPSMVIPNMWKLAKTAYSTNHVNFVNGSPIISDIYCTANCGGVVGGAASWRTILVGGLNGGGRGYYALDVTDPATPILLWEFTPTTGTGNVKDDDLGYSFGHPIITKRGDDTWVVLVTSGYNNTSPGDGKGYLYVLNASSGTVLSKIPTGVGDTTTPSGLAHIAGWNTEPAGNKVGYTYGGDLLGNVWRFDINAAASAGVNPLKFATLFADAAGTSPQPITTTPTLGNVSGKRIIFVGTGKYLETGDLTTTQKHSLYAIKDDEETTTLANPRSITKPLGSATTGLMVQQTITQGTGSAGAIRTGTTHPVNLLADRGWYLDFPDGGTGGAGAERVNIDSKLVQGTLVVPTIVPSSSVCSPGGYGWVNYFNYENGFPVTDGTGAGTVRGSNINVSVKYDSTIVGVNIIYIAGNPIVEIVTSNNPTPTIEPNIIFPPSGTGFTGKRTIWRELIP